MWQHILHRLPRNTLAALAINRTHPSWTGLTCRAILYLKKSGIQVTLTASMFVVLREEAATRCGFWTSPSPLIHPRSEVTRRLVSDYENWRNDIGLRTSSGLSYHVTTEDAVFFFFFGVPPRPAASCASTKVADACATILTSLRRECLRSWMKAPEVTKHKRHAFTSR